MPGKKTQQWSIGDFFTVKLADGTYVVGQVIDMPMPNVASCAFFDARIESIAPLQPMELTTANVISAASVIPAHLDRNVWKVFSNGPVTVAQESWPNEATRNNGWVGSKVYTGAIIENFLNAYYALAKWDMYFDPLYMDKLLFSPSKKPKTLLYKKPPERFRT